MCRGIVRFDGAQQYSRTPALLLHDDLQHICPKPQPPAGLAIVAAFHEAAEEPVRPRLPWKAAEEPVRSEPVRPRLPWKGAEEPVLPVRSGPDRPRMPWKGAEEPVRRPRLPILSLVLEPHDDDDDDEIEDLQPHDDDDDDAEIKHLQPQLTTHQTNNASNQQQQQQKITRDYPTYALSSKSRSSRKGAKKSIFSTGALSPPGYNSLGRPLPSPDFLATCFSCRCSLRPGEDIYMYRGDRAFCSTECRYKQIVADESPSCTLLPVDQRCPQSSSSINWLGFTPTAAAATINVLG